MSTYTITFCDLCNQDCRFSFKDLKELCPEGEFPEISCAIGTEEACLQNGWEQRDYGIVCPECARIESELEGRDDEEEAVDVQGTEILKLLATAQKAIDKYNSGAIVRETKEETNNDD